MSQEHLLREPRQARSRHTVSVILEATAQLLMEGGYATLSTNRIAQRAGVSVGSLYQYFAHKEAIVAALSEQFVDNHHAALVARLATLADDDIGVEAAIGRVIRAVMEVRLINPALWRALFGSIPSWGELSWLERWSARAVEVVTLAIAAHRDVLRISDPALSAYMLVHAVDGILHATASFHPELLTDDALADEVSAMVSRYLLPS